VTLPEHISKPSIVSTIKPLAINVFLSSEELATAVDLRPFICLTFLSHYARIDSAGDSESPVGYPGGDGHF
jgi:hypothetical protein